MSLSNEQRVELPVVEAPEHPARRVFLKAAAGAVGCVYAGMIGYPVYRYLESPVEKAAAAAAVSEVSLPKADALPPGSALMFKFGAGPALLIHQKDGSWSAMSAVCTHLACTVQYEPERDRIFCACHGGVYDPKTGANVSGPPPRPLDQFKVAVGAGSVTVTRG
ncbi:MAG: Rieske (2Fe-2S) protein [Planctomycetes bacterium]|nr:Rieske (2Fe-2S) protein [Planctomycetota bacterium]